MMKYIFKMERLAVFLKKSNVSVAICESLELILGYSLVQKKRVQSELNRYLSQSNPCARLLTAGGEAPHDP